MTEAVEDHFGEDNAEVKRLKTGDVVAPGVMAAVERKEISDFLGSLANTDSGGRLWRQMREMEKQYEHCALVVEGTKLEGWVADIYGGHAAAIRKVIGVCAWVDFQENWRGFWIQSGKREGKRLMCEYIEAFFRQAEKNDSDEDEQNKL